MAIIKKGILGGFSNKVGNVVGSSWKGISTMRSLPESYNDANSESQQEQRSAFKHYSEVGSFLLTSFIRPVLDPQAKRMSGYNMFVKQNLDALSSGELSSTRDIPIVSKGRLCEVYITKAEINPGESVFFLEWESSLTCATGDQNDHVYAFALDSSRNIAWAGKVGTRGKATPGAPGIYTGQEEISCPIFEEGEIAQWFAVAYSPRLRESSNQSAPKTITIG